MVSAADTIAALSSGTLPAGLAVIRASGTKVRFAIEMMCGTIPSARRAVLSTFRAADGTDIDSGLLIYFPSPASFTGEDVAEFHAHGGKAVVSALLDALTSLPGVRMAEPGEFTRRAFLNGKLDLTQAEGLSDLIAAETEAQRRIAQANATGIQSALYASWRNRLLHARAMIEAELDFSDEQDVPGSVSDSIFSDLALLASEIEEHVAGYRKAEMIRDGFDVVILGAPNVGKSTLLNLLVKRDVAIVSPEAGTTRDLIEVYLDLDGRKIRITDTAGLRAATGMVERIGIDRARQRAEEADLVLFLSEATKVVEPPSFVDPAKLLPVATKADLHPESMHLSQVCISAHTGEGVETLLAELSAAAKRAWPAFDMALPSRARHVALLRQTVTALQPALSSQLDLELRAEALRQAATHLGRVAGQTDVEDLLGVIFSSFCIGK